MPLMVQLKPKFRASMYDIRVGTHSPGYINHSIGRSCRIVANYEDSTSVRTQTASRLCSLFEVKYLHLGPCVGVVRL